MNILKKIRPYLRTKVGAWRHARSIHPYRKDLARLGKHAEAEHLLKLHFGCGPRVLKEWVNIDLHYEPYEKYLHHYGDVYPPELRGNRSDFYAMDILVTGIPLPDNSVDLIFHEDFIEHLPQKEQVLFLAETLRVLKPGAIHRVNTPDLAASMKRHSNFTQGAQGVYQREWDGNGHKNVFTLESLRDMAHMVGYNRIEFNGRNQSGARDIPPEYRPGIDRADHENIFANIIK